MRSIIAFVLVLLILVPKYCFASENEKIEEKKLQQANIVIGKFDLPVGSIIAWVPPNGVKSKTNYELEKLPYGFLLCDGALSKNDMQTEFDERLIPKLNIEAETNKLGYVWIIKVKK